MTRRGLSVAAAILLAAAIAMVAVTKLLAARGPTCPVGPPAAPGRPTTVTLIPDGFDSRHVGHLPDGRQFFLTTPFDPGGSDFVALYLFDPCGALLEARIDDLGPRPSGFEPEPEPVSGSLWKRYAALWKQYNDLRKRVVAVNTRYDARLAELGDVTFDSIVVQPFAIERYGLTFGFIGEQGEGRWTVSVEPGNYMVFYEPWDSGIYDT